jgi:hypothetical protein
MQRREVFHQQAMHEDVAADFAEENTFGAVAAPPRFRSANTSRSISSVRPTKSLTGARS